MAVNPKEKAALQKRWKDSKPAAQGRLSSCEWPDGEYQFEVTTFEGDLAKARFKAGYTLIGGNDELVGQEHLQFENLTGSEQSMDYFKARMVAIGIPEDELPDDIEELFSEEFAAKVLGRKFVGQAKNNKDYLNVYANRPIEGEDEDDAMDAAGDAAQEETQEETAEGEIGKGSRVTFVSKKDGDQAGEVLEVTDGVALVKGDNGTKYKLPLDRLTAEATEEATQEETQEETVEEEAAEETQEEAPAKGKSKLPALKAIQGMKAPEVKQLLTKLGLKYEAVKQPREFAVGVAGLVHDKKYMPPIALLPALTAGLGVKVARGAKPAAVVAQLRQKALARFS